MSHNELFDFEDMLAEKGIKIPNDDSEEYIIDRLYHDASEDELRKMGVFDNLNDEEEE